MLPFEPTQELQERNPDLQRLEIHAPDGVPKEECGDVVALVGQYRSGVFDGGPLIKTFWKPSEEEIQALVMGAVIDLTFFANQMPMTSMNVETV